MDGDNMKSKFITSVLIVVIIVILVVGITFAYITWQSSNINNTGNSECFDILYVKGTDIGSDQNKATLMPSDDYAGGLSSTVKIGIDSKCTGVQAKGKIQLYTLSDTSSNLFREGLLNYVVLNGTTKIKEGNITSTDVINIDIGNLKKVSSVNDADSYTVYVWISNDLVENNDAFSNYYGKIAASVEQYDY